MQLPKLELAYDELKSLVLQVLHNKPQTQYIEILYSTAGLAVTKKIVPNLHQGVVSGATYDLHSSDKDRVLEIIWDLVIERVLTMGREGANGGWPFFNLTSYGLKVAELLRLA
jgi:hypothetical protein